MAIKLRKDLAEAESAEQRANILGIQGLIAGSEVDALLNPLYEVDLEGNISRNRNYGATIMRDPNNRYFSLGSGVGSDYFSLLNALKAQKEIVGSHAKVISTGKVARESLMLQNDLDWYNANQISGIFGKFTPIINSLLLNLLKSK
jgi:aspartyl aminopeptidase